MSWRFTYAFAQVFYLVLYNVKSCLVSFFCLWHWVSSTSFVEEIILSLLHILALWSRSVDSECIDLFLVSIHIDLCVCLYAIPFCLNYRSFAIYFEISVIFLILFFFKIVLSMHGVFWFHMNCRIGCFSFSLKSAIVMWVVIALNLWLVLGSMAISAVLSCGLGVILHLLVLVVWYLAQSWSLVAKSHHLLWHLVHGMPQSWTKIN